jgi:ATP-dependent DNA ligase
VHDLAVINEQIDLVAIVHVMADTIVAKKKQALTLKLQSPLPNSICFHMLRRTLAARFIAPCLPTKTDKLPSGSQWLHEIKHDGSRIIAGKDGPRVIASGAAITASKII